MEKELYRKPQFTFLHKTAGTFYVAGTRIPSSFPSYLFLSAGGRETLLLFHFTLIFSWKTVLFKAMKYRSKMTSRCLSLRAERVVVAERMARACCSLTSTERHSFSSFTSGKRERPVMRGLVCYNVNKMSNNNR